VKVVAVNDAPVVQNADGFDLTHKVIEHFFDRVGVQVVPPFNRESSRVLNPRDG
jgi:hypothetical protein